MVPMCHGRDAKRNRRRQAVVTADPSSPDRPTRIFYCRSPPLPAGRGNHLFLPLLPSLFFSPLESGSLSLSTAVETFWKASLLVTAVSLRRSWLGSVFIRRSHWLSLILLTFLAHPCTRPFGGETGCRVFLPFFFLVGITDCQRPVQGPATTVKCFLHTHICVYR
jgi:hypothetical protein